MQNRKMKTTGNTILITGATAGIGLAMTQKFLLLGNTIIATGRNIAALDALKQQYPNTLFAYPCNLENRENVQQLVTLVTSNHPQLNVLINNAGVQYNYELLHEANLTDKLLQEVEININATLLLTAGLLPILNRQNAAAVVNVSSGLALVPKKSAAVYCGSKAFIHSFSKALRYQLENTKIKVFEVLPSLVNTQMTAGRGKGKIEPLQLVDEFIKNFANNSFQIYIGKTKILKLLLRISPKVAHLMLKNS
jgi:uncharacterized oxidoreductase